MDATEMPSFLAKGLSYFIYLYSLILILRVLLTWFPTINWRNPPFSILSQLTDPYLNLFRSLLPPMGGMDFSPMLAILVLSIIGSLF